MPPLTLSKRLAAIAALVPRGANVIDVGTDHGYIPVYLALTGLAGHITASDKMPGPLGHARRTAEEYGVSESIEFRLCAGLPPERGDIDAVVISGMGGETIIEILSAAPWISGGVTLILQPQTKHNVLLAWLNEQGFEQDSETGCTDRGRNYFIYVYRKRYL